MFVNMVEFPKIKKGKDAEFKKWFRWSNSVYTKFDGFISRRLLKPIDENGKYAAIVEHRSKRTFMKMHLSPTRQEAWSKVEPHCSQQLSRCHSLNPFEVYFGE